MKLSNDQLDALNELRRATGRPAPVHAPLETLGLVVTGASRFGPWAKLTEAGRQYLGRMPGSGGRAATPRDPGDTGYSDPHGSPAAPARRRRSPGQRPASVTTAPAAAGVPPRHTPPSRPSKGEATICSPASGDRGSEGVSLLAAHSFRGAAPRTRRIAANQARLRSAITPPADALAVGETDKGLRGAARFKSAQAGAEPVSGLRASPNAVRVQRGQTYFYYPVTAFKELRDASCCLVVTRAKLYSSIAVAAPETDADIVLETAAGDGHKRTGNRKKPGPG